MAKWAIRNVVASIKFNVRLPLEKIATIVEEAEYEPEQFPGLILRFGEGKPTALLFNTGTIIVSGGRTAEDIKNTVEKIKEILKGLGINLPEHYDINVQNLVIQGSFDYENIDVLRMAEELEDSEYNPEQFPGIVVRYKKDDETATFLVYSNGKFVCTGVKKLEKAKKIIEEFEEEVIKKYSKPQKK